MNSHLPKQRTRDTGGGYVVSFDQDVSNCASSATPAKNLQIGALSEAPDNPNQVLVVIGEPAVDMDFSVEAFC